jgi:hypothetical protein
MDSGQLTVEKLTQILQQHTFPASVDTTLIAIREFSMFARKDLSMLANRFIFCHSLSSNSSQTVWTKTLNNIQELHTLDILRQFLENQSDLIIATRVFDIIFVDILSDSDHPLFTLYYNLLLKFLSLVISFESKLTLTIITRWFLTLSKTMDSLTTKIIQYIIHEHIALAITKSINNLCLISPLFTLCFINQTCILLDKENLSLDTRLIQTLIELLTYGLTNSTNLLLITLQQEFLSENKENSLVFNFIPSMIRLNVLFPLRSFQSSSLRLHLDHFHTSILSFLFSIVINNPHQNNILQKNLFSPNYFQQLSLIIQNSIEHEKPNEKNLDECIQRYLQILSICKTSSLPLTQFHIADLGKDFPLFTRHKLFDVLKHKEEQDMNKIE